MASLISDIDIEKLEKVKDILKEIKELNIGFGLDNIIEVDKETTLVFTTENILKDCHIQEYADELTDRLQCKCIILHKGFKLDKAVNVGTDYAKGKDYTTESFYQDGQIIKEITTQYK